MSVGFPIAKADIDTMAGRLTLAVWKSLDDVRLFNAFLNDSGHTNLLLLDPLGYTSGEETTLRAAFADLDKLRQIAHAANTQASANDFFFNAKNLTGLSYTAL